MEIFERIGKLKNYFDHEKENIKARNY